ncbi:MAG TPA: hypothetical protein VNZ59_16165, partial [Burkholderiales bacterium]|nr:hypothetical protein [Burkholderiales bacterium]
GRRAGRPAGAHALRFRLRAARGARSRAHAVHYVAAAAAGRGAVREVCELLMRAQSTFERTLGKYLA